MHCRIQMHMKKAGELQDEFADFVQSVEKSKFECIGKKEKFEIEKDTFVHKYFR